MLLKQIRYFVAVVETASFTEAAEKCFISQSAISQQIKSLETELGTELIHRENRSFSLTQAGNFSIAKDLYCLMKPTVLCVKRCRLESITMSI